MRTPVKALDVLMALGVAVIFGTGVVFAKAAIDHFPPILLMSIRFSVAAAVLLWFVRPPWHLMGKIFFAALVGAAIQYSLTFSGLAGLDASIMILVVQLEVPFAAVLAWLVFKDPLGWRGFAGMMIAFVGIAVISGSPDQRGNLLPILLVAGGSLAFAVGQIMIKRIGQIGGLTMIACVAAMAGPQLLVSSLIFERGQWEAIVGAPPVVWWAVAFLALVMTSFGYAMWYDLLGRLDVTRVIPYLLLVPVTTVLGGVFFLGEPMTLLRFAGGALVIRRRGDHEPDTEPASSSISRTCWRPHAMRRTGASSLRLTRAPAALHPSPTCVRRPRPLRSP